VAGVGEGRGCSGVTTANRDGRRRSEDVGGVPVAEGQEGDRYMAKQPLHGDVVPAEYLARARGRWINGMTARPSGGGSLSSPA
jgi:hypothetical protein